MFQPRRLSSALLVIFALRLALFGQVDSSLEREKQRLFDNEMAQYRGAFSRTLNPAAGDTAINATYYRLNLRLTVNPNYLIGSVTMTARAVHSGMTAFSLDLHDSMTVDSVILNGLPAGFTHVASKLTVTLDRPYADGEAFTAVTYYRGVPVSDNVNNFGAFIFSDHLGTPWIWTLSEPYGARNWWPCNDYPADKADSVDMIVTCDSAFKVGSNGALISRTFNGDGTATTHWAERYPISSYLVSIAVTNFAEFSNWFRYSPADSMRVLNYVLPEHLADAQLQLPSILDGLRIFSHLFGLYPFIREKYGHSEFGWGGAMEHQTMTSTTTFNENIITHELSHQWFGDKITCGSWHDIWLNEGFATYCEALYAEQKYGFAQYRQAIRSDSLVALASREAILNVDTSNVNVLFNHATTYAKGGLVLHMLRHVLGDSVFFRGMYAYANDTALAYRNAVTADFRRVMETVSGKDLAYFFNEWMYQTGYPHYQVSGSASPTAGGVSYNFTIHQALPDAAPSIFVMPIDLVLHMADGDTLVTVWDDSVSKTFTFNLPAAPISVALDPDGWIFKAAVTPITGTPTTGYQPSSYYLAQNYPQPFNPSTTIRYGIARSGLVTIKIYSILGQEVATLVNSVRGAGNYQAVWDGSSMPTGVYFCRMQSGGFFESRKLLLIR